MDENKAVETTLTSQLMLNERIVEHPTYGTIRLHRPTPRMEFAIGELRGRQYQRDLSDETILSKTELEKIAIRRGIWTKEDSTRSTEIQIQIAHIMALLDNVGYKTKEVLREEYYSVVTGLLETFAEQEDGAEAREAVLRYFDLDNDTPKQDDHSLIFKSALNSTTEDKIESGRLLRTQIKLLDQLEELSSELQPLLVASTRLFKDSIEMRADRTEALAKLYHCVTREGKPLWLKFDQIMDEKPSDLELLLEEMYFFERGIPDHERTILGRHGFTLRAPIENSSDDLPGSPQPNSDGESQPNEQISSGNSTELITQP